MNGANRPGRYNEKGRAISSGGRSFGKNLREVVLERPWPRPTVNGNHNRKGLSKTSGDGLATAVAKTPWPTPTTTERPNEGNVRTLRAKVLSGEISHEEATAMLGKSPLEAQGKLGPWGTPTARDWKDGSSVANVPENGLLGRQVVNRSEIPGKLHGRWTLCLMGFPPDWCDDLPPDPLGTTPT